MIAYDQIQIHNHHKVVHANVNYKAKEELFLLLKNHQIDLEEALKIRNEKRLIEWMTIRALLIQLLPDFCDIYYDEHHKPFLKDCTQHLSISHSHHKVAISINDNHNTGIDIQHIVEKIINIREKFLNEKEQKRQSTHNPQDLTLYWSIKEALFKIYGKNDIFLKENIQVDELNFNNCSGTAIGSIKTANYYSEHSLELKLIDNYVLAYVVN